MRTEYSWIPAGESAGRTEPNQVGVSFTPHHAAVFASLGKTREADIAAGSVFVTGSEPITWMRVRETSEALEIFPDDRLLMGVEIEPVAAGRDGTVLAISSVLKRAHTAGHDVTDVGASTLAHRLAEHLIERYSPAQPQRRPGRLSSAAVDRVAQFVDAELSGELTLDRLAAVATLSPFHFARAFKATTGQAPHQFVTARRMDRATILLLANRSVMDTAHAVGMSNVSHFRRVFRAHTGVLPGQVSKIRPSQRRTGVRSSRP